MSGISLSDSVLFLPQGNIGYETVASEKIAGGDSISQAARARISLLKNDESTRINSLHW
jgi:hypothetical protein